MSDNGRTSVPPSFSPEERELILRRLKVVDERVGAVEVSFAEHSRDHARMEDSIRDLSRDFADLAKDVRGMITRDAEIERTLGLHGTKIEQLAGHAGGLVGGVTGAASGTEAARDVSKKWKPAMVVITMVTAAITGGIVSGLAQSATPVKPIPAAVFEDQDTRDRVARLELEMKRRNEAPKATEK